MKTVWFLLLECLLVHQFQALNKARGPVMQQQKIPPTTIQKATTTRSATKRVDQMSVTGVGQVLSTKSSFDRKREHAKRDQTDTENCSSVSSKSGTRDHHTSRRQHREPNPNMLNIKISTWIISQVNFTSLSAKTNMSTRQMEGAVRLALRAWSTVSNMDMEVFNNHGPLVQGQWLIKLSFADDWTGPSEDYSLNTKTTTLHFNLPSFKAEDAEVPWGMFYLTALFEFGLAFRLRYTHSKGCIMTDCPHHNSIANAKKRASLCEDDIATIREIQGFRSEVSELTTTSSKPCTPWNGTRYTLVNRVTATYFVADEFAYEFASTAVSHSSLTEEDRKRHLEIYFIKERELYSDLKKENITVYSMVLADSNRWIKFSRNPSTQAAIITEEEKPHNKSGSMYGYYFAFFEPSQTAQSMIGLCYMYCVGMNAYLRPPKEQLAARKAAGYEAGANDAVPSINYEYQLRPVRGSPCYPKLGVPHYIRTFIPIRSIVTSHSMVQSRGRVFSSSSSDSRSPDIIIGDNPQSDADELWTFEAVGSSYLIINNKQKMVTASRNPVHAMKHDWYKMVTLEKFDIGLNQLWHIERMRDEKCIIISDKGKYGWFYSTHNNQTGADGYLQWVLSIDYYSFPEERQWFTISEPRK